MIPIGTSIELRGAPGAVIGLIIANVAIFLLEIGLPADLAKQFIMHNGLVPARYTQIGFANAYGLEPANLFPFITNAFMHSSWWHLIVNMWTLWLFGGPLEQRLGAARFVLFYLGCGVAASVVHFTFNLTSPLPALGASGAIVGVLGGFSFLHPRERVLLLTPVLFFPVTYRLPAPVYTGLWFALQIFGALAHWFEDEQKGGIAWGAHIGGFAIGFAVIRLLGAVRSTTREIGGTRSPGVRIGSWRPSVVRLGSPTLESGRLPESRPRKRFSISRPRTGTQEAESPWREPGEDAAEDSDDTQVMEGPWHRPGEGSRETQTLKVPWAQLARGGNIIRTVTGPWSRHGRAGD